MGDVAGEVTIFIAASLNRCFDSLTTAFEAQYPDVRIVRESGGSRDQCRKVTQLQREADIIASADYELIPEMLVPDHADWAVAFARNRVVIAYTDKSKFAREINGNNWYEVLQREGVRYGYADPGKAPVGYRTLILWKLADKHYSEHLEGQSIYERLLAGCPQTCVRPDVQELVPLIESMDLDYIFVYRNVALEHNLQFVKLPDEIDLSSERFAGLYAKAEVEVPGGKPGQTVTKRGTPCLYGLTILKAAPNRQAATAFVQFLLGPEGMQLIEDCFVEPISPALCASPDLLPPSLQALVEQREDL
jgi:molybdate/tungstate transport system substrate-binding protein